MAVSGKPDKTDTVFRFRRTGEAKKPGYEWINDTDKRIAYIGSWYYTSLWSYDAKSRAEGCYERSAHCDCDGAGNAAYTAFEGSAVELYGVLDPENGAADVYIDGIFCGTVDEQAPEHKGHALLFRSINLYGGQHVFQLYTKDDRPFLLDAIRVIE
jgi:hypothetical protein